MDWHCPECGVALVVHEAEVKDPEGFEDSYTGLRGTIYRCPDCGTDVFVWGPATLASKSLGALFCLGLGTVSASFGLLGALNLLGFGPDPTGGGEVWVIVSVLGLLLGWACFTSYPPLVYRQLRQRQRLQPTAMP